VKFRKRLVLDHHSLYVQGFILDEVEAVAEPAELGAIPKSWVKLAGWNDRADDYSDPPAEFWRTLVADRGRGNGKPPYNYATACKESMKACMRQLESRCFLRLRYDRILAKAESRHQRDMYQQEIREEQVAINGQIEEWRKRYEDDFIRRKREDEDIWKRKVEAEHRRSIRDKLLKRPRELGDDVNSTGTRAAEMEKRSEAQEEARGDDSRFWYKLHGGAYISGMMDWEAITEHIMGGIPLRTFEIR